MMLYFLRQGLKPGGFAKDLAGEKPKTMEELKKRAKKWIQIEEWVRIIRQIIKPLNRKEKRETNRKILMAGDPRRMRKHMIKAGDHPGALTQLMPR